MDPLLLIVIIALCLWATGTYLAITPLIHVLLVVVLLIIIVRFVQRNGL